jgi:hypothetical protein
MARNEGRSAQREQLRSTTAALVELALHAEVGSIRQTAMFASH